MASLAYVHFIAGFTLQFVYAAFVVVGCHSMAFGSGLLLYHVRAFERYLDVCLFKEVCDFSDFGTMICEDGPFIVFVMCGFCVEYISSVLLCGEGGICCFLLWRGFFAIQFLFCLL